MWLTCELKTSWVHLLSQIYPTNRNLAFNFQCWNTRRKWLKNYKVFLYFGLIISTVLLGATSFPLTISAWKSCQDPGFVVNVGGCLNSLNSPIFQYCLPQPFFAPSTLLETPPSFISQPLVWVLHLCGFLRDSHCLSDGEYGLTLVFPGVPCVGKDRGGPKSAWLCSTCFALASTLLPSSNVTYISFSIHVSPTMLPGEHISSASLLLHFMKWYSKSTHIEYAKQDESIVFQPTH